MPFSDMDGYEPGHFGRVYEHLIRPACIDAGLQPIRGDEVKGTNYIAIDILQRILKSDVLVCDLSGRNANVMYELGVRQAFDLPVVLLKDRRTERIFDIQGLRTLDYTETLRVDTVQHDRSSLSQAILATLSMESHEVNSLVKLLGIEKATLGNATQVSGETALVLASLKDISARLAVVEEVGLRTQASAAVGRVVAQTRPRGSKLKISGGGSLTVGDSVFDLSTDKAALLGTLLGWGADGVMIQPESGEPFLVRSDDPKFRQLSEIPF
jgi:hypothetical protein